MNMPRRIVVRVVFGKQCGKAVALRGKIITDGVIDVNRKRQPSVRKSAGGSTACRSDLQVATAVGRVAWDFYRSTVDNEASIFNPDGCACVTVPSVIGGRRPGIYVAFGFADQ